MHILIPSDYRDYTLRKQRLDPEMERRIRQIVRNARNHNEAHRLLQKEGISERVIDLIIQKNFRIEWHAPNPKDCPQKVPEQQMELIRFSQNVGWFSIECQWRQ